MIKKHQTTIVICTPSAVKEDNNDTSSNPLDIQTEDSEKIVATGPMTHTRDEPQEIKLNVTKEETIANN